MVSNGSIWPVPEDDTRWLIRLPNWIGDAIMVLPALRALPRRTQRWLGIAHPRVLDLYRATGLFDELLPASGASAPLRLRRAVHRFKPDRAVVFTQAPSGALLARFSEARLRLGWNIRPMGGALFTHTAPQIDRRLPLWRSYRELARHGGASGEEAPDFVLDPGEKARTVAADLLDGLDGSPIALAPGASYGPAKHWPIANYRRLAEMLIGRGDPVIILGGRAEKLLASRLEGTGARNLAGRTGLLEAIAVLQACRGTVANDSGALHLARAAGTPVVALFGSTSPTWTGPTEAEGEAIWLGLECSPCFARRCRLGGADHLACLTGIEPERVLAALDGHLRPSP